MSSPGKSGCTEPENRATGKWKNRKEKIRGKTKLEKNKNMRNKKDCKR